MVCGPRTGRCLAGRAPGKHRGLPKTPAISQSPAPTGGNAQALPPEFDQDFYLRNRANHSANVRSSIVAGCRVNASLPQRSHRSHQSPGPRASLSGATVFFQPHLSQTNVKGLGLTGMSLLLCRAFAEFDVPPCSLETTVAVYR